MPRNSKSVLTEGKVGKKPAKKAKTKVPTKPAWWFNVTYRGHVKAGDLDWLREDFVGDKSSPYAVKLDAWLETCKAGDSIKIGSRKVECKLSPEPVAKPVKRPDPTPAPVAVSYEGVKPVQAASATASEAVSLTDRLRGRSFHEMLAKRRAEVDLDTFEFRGGRRPTQEQKASIAAALEGPAVLILEAGAGTGKTSNFQMLAQVLPGNGQYCSFGKAQTDDAKPKFGGTKVAVNTTHSLAFRAVGFQFADRLGGKRKKAEEVAKILGLGEIIVETEVEQKDGTRVPTKRALAPGFLAGQVMGAVRRWCQGADREVTTDHFRYIDGIDLPDMTGRRTYTNNRLVAERLVPYAQKAWADLNDPKGQLPYWPDCYVKTWQLGKPIIAADFILCDECQDLSDVFLDILRQQMGSDRKQPPMLILCGDSAQQIYEWRGAKNALTSFPGAPRLFLSQSFRFGEAIAQAANSVLETLEEETPLRLKGLPSIPSKLEPLTDPQCVLCRTNAAAVATLLGGIAAGKRPHLVGGGADVLSFCEAMLDLQAGRPTSHPDLGCFSSWGEVELYAQCFPKGTSVATDGGLVPIETIVENSDRNWQVLASVDGGKTLDYSLVVAAYKTPIQKPLVRIQHDQGEITCTANHPIWVYGQGWKQAGSITAGDPLCHLRSTKPSRQGDLLQVLYPQEVVACNMEEEKGGQGHSRAGVESSWQPVPDLRQTHQGEKEQDLFSDLRGQVEKVPHRSGDGEDSCPENFRNHESDSEGVCGTNAGGEVSNFGHDESEGHSVDDSWGKRQRPDKAREAVVSAIGSTPTELALEPRLCSLAWRKEEGSLQNRHSFVEESDCSRSGRCEPRGSSSQTTGCSQELSPQISRVVSVEVCQSRSGHGPGSRGQESDQYVYTLTVQAGSYFAEGVLVKNCDDGEDLRLWVKLVNAFGAQEIRDAVKHMPKEADADFVVCTAHKSKGREWDTVKLASDYPTNDRAGDEERRLLYVAVTRAKLILDVSECPFFTGEGGIDLTSAIAASVHDREHATSSVIPPTPAVPKPAVQGIQSWSWAKGQDGDWLLRGPKGVKQGTRVQVERRDGSVSWATVGKVEKDWPEACLYRKG